MKPNRPPLLTVLCLTALLGCFFRIYYVFSPEIQNVRSWYPLYVSLETVFLIVCLYNLFMMRKWSFWAFSIFLILHQMVQWQVDRWDVSALALFLAIEMTAAFYYRRMTR
ncbi:MAG TPA: hypothetical protein VK859_04165 [bacterium]|nr:hypothetical protein [bacterium]